MGVGKGVGREWQGMAGRGGEEGWKGVGGRGVARREAEGWCGVETAHFHLRATVDPPLWS